MDNNLLIANFKELSKENIPLAGGKGAALGELTRAHMPVPPGFVITTAAYDAVVKQNNLETLIATELQRENRDGALIRDAFINASIPAKLEHAILEAYHTLEKREVAVRSSATAEDLPEAAFAGQQDTHLNIAGDSALLDAVRHIWASLWTERAIAYRARQNIRQESVKLAVVVQQMAHAEFAGVMFTANPVTGNRKDMVIDANPGLGEAIVSGAVTPDHIVLQKAWYGWRIKEKKTGRREVIVRSKKSGGTEHIKNSNGTARLPQKVLINLTRIGVKIEKHFGTPQDIEWVWTGKHIFIVQSRPVTALPEALPKQGKLRRMVSGTIAEILPHRPYPLESTVLGVVIDKSFSPSMKKMGLRIHPADTLFIEEDGIPLRYNGRFRIRPASILLLTPFKLLGSAVFYNPSRWKSDSLVEETVSTIKRLEKKQVKNLSLRELISIVYHVLDIFSAIAEIRLRYMPRVAFAMLGLSLLLPLVRRRDTLETLVLTGLNTKVTQTNRELENLAAAIRRDEHLSEIFQKTDTPHIATRLKETQTGKHFLKQFENFLKEYGYRETGGSFSISRPAWVESPDIVFGMLKGLSAAPKRPRSKKDIWKETRDDLITRSILRFQPLRWLFLKCLTTARHFHELREDTRFYIMMALPLIRRAMLEVGSRLVAATLCTEPEDIFYLRFEEMEEIAQTFPLQPHKANEFRALILRRKRKYTELQHIPFINPKLYQAPSGDSGEALLSGTPGSPGIAQGPVCIIHDSSEFAKLRPGDILVAPYTNPAWTPLFERAGGVIVDTGGVISHAAIVAREYGIPAIMGTGDGTAKLKDGMEICVNGTEGKVVQCVTQHQQNGTPRL